MISWGRGLNRTLFWILGDGSKEMVVPKPLLSLGEPLEKFTLAGYRPGCPPPFGEIFSTSGALHASWCNILIAPRYLKDNFSFSKIIFLCKTTFREGTKVSFRHGPGTIL